ncbi:streptomycin 6-kinase [Paenibacillus cellulosilyticus]|uniref:Streptomycin 6-kinase n=1 Tax=Paenibacillus cellulosilyticus TaxID=375489 RepID=A0A2V2YP10_9BACL|nr:aminoglycoside phosphotransferase family protein [Paenibacillus cellulosilyticus]PWV95831.1 streptomycin 6-kinase [Paenibacillus cellulosilyticus]QKS47708.1 phosphotransferase [Paenibacillus cellulosilyticus]
MSSHYLFQTEEIMNIVNRFGQPFYDKVVKDMETYVEKWALTSLQLIPSYSVNLVFRCHSAQYGAAVLKISKVEFGGIEKEWQTLNHYAGRRMCRVFEADLEAGVLLEQGMLPGTPLRAVEDLDKRLDVFCSLYRDMHLPPAAADSYPTYAGWVNRITDYMSTRNDCIELYEHMRRAQEMLAVVTATYAQSMLLHGDFHHDNILLGEDGEYRIIDPKGVIGDPVFDTPRFILNEFGDDMTPEVGDKINHIIAVFAEQLQIPSQVLRQCLYIETTMGVCWCAEDGATPEEYAKLLATAAFAESLLHE